jgi:hypothetical protein
VAVDLRVFGHVGLRLWLLRCKAVEIHPRKTFAFVLMEVGGLQLYCDIASFPVMTGGNNGNE